MVERIEQVGPVRLRAMQDLAERVSPATGYRHIGDLAWSWTLYHDRPDDCPTARGTRGTPWSRGPGWNGFTCRPVRPRDAERRDAVHRAAFEGSRLTTER